jgi:hypothetical protein
VAPRARDHRDVLDGLGLEQPRGLTRPSLIGWAFDTALAIIRGAGLRVAVEPVWGVPDEAAVVAGLLVLGKDVGEVGQGPGALTPADDPPAQLGFVPLSSAWQPGRDDAVRQLACRQQ